MKKKKTVRKTNGLLSKQQAIMMDSALEKAEYALHRIKNCFNDFDFDQTSSEKTLISIIRFAHKAEREIMKMHFQWSEDE